MISAHDDNKKYQSGKKKKYHSDKVTLSFYFRYPFLLPILEQEYVAQKILNAILEEQLYLVMPKFMYFALLFKQ